MRARRVLLIIRRRFSILDKLSFADFAPVLPSVSREDAGPVVASGNGEKSRDNEAGNGDCTGSASGGGGGTGSFGGGGGVSPFGGFGVDDFEGGEFFDGGFEASERV